MRARLVILILGVAAGLVAASGATAKDFRPGDLRICNHHRCVAIRKHSVVRRLGPFYYTGRTPPPAARAPRLGAPASSCGSGTAT